MTLVKWPQQQAAKDGATMAGLVKEDTMARVKWPLHVVGWERQGHPGGLSQEGYHGPGQVATACTYI